MNTTNLTAAIRQPLAQLRKAHQVELAQPRERMLQLNAVPLGPLFNKRCTNALLRQKPGAHNWIGHVDEDLAYLGDDPARRALFAGPRRKGWLELAPIEPVLGDVNRGIVWLLGELDSPLREMAVQGLPNDYKTEGCYAHTRVGMVDDVTAIH